MDMEYLRKMVEKTQDYDEFLRVIGNAALSATGRYVIRRDWKRVEQAEILVRENGYGSLASFYVREKEE